MFELFLGVGQSVGLMMLNTIPVVGTTLYWTNVALSSLSETRHADSMEVTYALGAARFAIEYFSEQIFVDSILQRWGIKTSGTLLWVDI